MAGAVAGQALDEGRHRGLSQQDRADGVGHHDQQGERARPSASRKITASWTETNAPPGGWARLFGADNGCRLQCDKADAVRAVEQRAAGRLGEDALAEWFRGRPAGGPPGARPPLARLDTGLVHPAPSRLCKIPGTAPLAVATPAPDFFPLAPAAPFLARDYQAYAEEKGVLDAFIIGKPFDIDNLIDLAIQISIASRIK